MKDMAAIVITRYGGPEVLEQQRLPIPDATPGTVVVRVRAFGLNHAEAYFRAGVWGEVAKVSGIECVGEVHDPGSTQLRKGERVFALMGGMGRTINGSYAEYLRAPEASVVAIDSALDWTDLAAIPESYATAWMFLHHNLEVCRGQQIVVRGGTSALGQAIINVARDLDVRVLATTRSRDKARILEALGAEPLIDERSESGGRGPTGSAGGAGAGPCSIETAGLSAELRRRIPAGVDGVIDIIGTATLLDSLQMVRYRGRVAMAGFLGGGAPLTVDPLQLPSGVQFSFFASAFMFGGPDVPLSRIPFGAMVARVERGVYRAAPAHVFELAQIVEAHRLMESGTARGKIVVRTS